MSPKGGSAAVVAQQPLFPEEVAMGFVVQAKVGLSSAHAAGTSCGRRLIAHHDRSDWAPLAWVWFAEARIFATRVATFGITLTPSQIAAHSSGRAIRHVLQRGTVCTGWQNLTQSPGEQP